MSEYIDIYIDTTTKVPEDATEFDYELFERFMSGGPWVAHSEYMKLKDDNAKLREDNERLIQAIEDLHDVSLEDRLVQLENENDRMRELVRALWEGYNDPRCEECHLKDTPTCADCPICAREASVIDRMRELGVGRG